MDETMEANDLSHWFSTYGTITAERLLGKYQINLPSDELLLAIKSPSSFYHRLLQIPLKNVLNGIILQQANDYHIYAQKLFIDYLLSGESNKPPEAQGAMTRESLEEERIKLVTLGEEFHKKELQHNSLIAASQSALIKLTKTWRDAFETGLTKIDLTLKQHIVDGTKSKIRKALNHGFINSVLTEQQGQNSTFLFIDKFNEAMKLAITNQIKEQLADNVTDLLDVTFSIETQFTSFIEQTLELAEQARSYRSQFYDTILRVTELLKLLPDYRVNPEQDAINREPLYFDKSIGETA